MSYSESREVEAIHVANSRRAEGAVVELSLTPQTKADAEKSCADKNCSELIYVE